MKTSRVISIFLGRLFLSLVFFVSGFDTLIHWYDNEKSLMDALADWQNYTGFSESIQNFFAMLVPSASILLIIGVIFELLGSFLLIIAYREKFGVALLILFLIPATVLFHSFWFFEGPERTLQLTMFLKNMAILGGLIFVMIHGANARGDGGSSMSSMSFS
jgi:putative oxidoreductase